MRRLLARAALSLACALAMRLPGASAPSDLVIVVDESSPVRSISVADVRRRYLGIPVVVDGIEVVPVRNLSDADFYEMFLQRVLFMSAQSYERRMVSKIFREGGSSILAVGSRDELYRTLHN